MTFHRNTFTRSNACIYWYPWITHVIYRDWLLFVAHQPLTFLHTCNQPFSLECSPHWLCWKGYHWTAGTVKTVSKPWEYATLKIFFTQRYLAGQTVDSHDDFSYQLCRHVFLTQITKFEDCITFQLHLQWKTEARMISRYKIWNAIPTLFYEMRYPLFVFS